MSTAVTPPAELGLNLDHLIDFVRTAAIGLHWVNAEGIIVWANPADYEPLGYTAEEYLGHNIAEFHADADTIADILRRLKSGERLSSYEAQLRAKDGSLRHVQITSSVLFEDGPQGKEFVHTRCYTQDITERKRIALARDRFIAILGHDLRNPLNAISVAVDILQKASDIPDKHRRTLSRAAHSADRMSRMVADLIEFARSLGGCLIIQRRPCNLGEICNRAISEVQLAHPSAVIQLTTEGDLSGEWDAERALQAVTNLIGNAVKHGKGAVAVRLRGEDAAVVLEVSNGGLPISEASLPSIFEPFSSTAGSDGLGLGLFIVSEIVAAHGGFIGAASSAEKGTRLTSRWPRH